MRYCLFLILGVTCWSCREIQPFDEFSDTVQGYQVRGSVTTQSGAPLDSVVIDISYDAEIISFSPMDTVTVIVTDSIKTVYVAVYTPSHQFIKELFRGTRHPGILPRFQWNERDQFNTLVPSGKYLIRYVYDTAIVKDVPYIVDGNPTTITNTNGDFTIGGDNLPVGAIFDYYRPDNTYGGTYRIQPSILLRLTKGSRQATSLPISLELNIVKRIAFTL